MPMLAERKRKTKWMLNPGRQPLWKTDSSGTQFGKELMEKMGWRVGQGLGVSEQGIKEPLNITFKSDNKGVGFKDNENEWIQQQHDFNQLLGQLASCNNVEERTTSKDIERKTSKSLEEKSKRSKARVHYHKFTRGKDLTRYSEKDLECILGSNKRESTDYYENDNEQLSGNYHGDEGGEVINARSMVDYFAEKMRNKMNAKKDEGFLKTESNAVEDSLNYEHDAKGETFSEAAENETHKAKKKKSKRNKEEKASLRESTDIEGWEEASMVGSETAKKTGFHISGNSNKKLRSKKEQHLNEVDNPGEALDTEACESISTTLLKDCISNVVETHTEDGMLKKKKKRKRRQSECEDHDKDYTVSKHTEEFAQHRKRKKKKMTYDGVENNEFKSVNPDGTSVHEENAEVEQHVETNVNADKKKDAEKKKKKKKKKKEKAREKSHAGEEGKNAENRENCEFVNNEYSYGKDNGIKNIGHEERASSDTQLESMIYKAELLKRASKLESKVGNKLLNLIYCANLEKFNGSNLGLVKGYGIIRYTDQNVG